MGQRGGRPDRVLDDHRVAESPRHAGVHALRRPRRHHVALLPVAALLLAHALATRHRRGRRVGRAQARTGLRHAGGHGPRRGPSTRPRRSARTPALAEGGDRSRRSRPLRPAARRQRAQVARACALVVRLHTSARQMPAALRALRLVRDEARRETGVLRVALGVGRLGDCYLLALWTGEEGRDAMRRSPTLRAAQGRWPAGCWINDWEPENEFGHWDGLRVRRTDRGGGVPMAVPVIGGRRRAPRRLTLGRGAPPAR